MKTGFGSLMSVHWRFAAAFSLVSGTVMPVISASVKVLFTRIWPNCVRSACLRSKWIEFVLCVRQVKSRLSLLGDRAAEAAAERVARLEVLVEAALPDLRRRPQISAHRLLLSTTAAFMSDIRATVKHAAETSDRHRLDSRPKVRHKRH